MLAIMATVILIRHGRSTANVEGVLAGRSGGVGLDATGHSQARRTAEQLQNVTLAKVVSSPLKRCRQTARAIAELQQGPQTIQDERGINECDYGHWQGRKVSDLAGEDLWSTVQTQPSAAVFPGGESLMALQSRAVSAIRRHDAALAHDHGTDAVWAAVSHGDTIKSILADALGMHLDLFQRITVNPASASIIRYTQDRPYVVAMNTADMSSLGADVTTAAGQIGGGAGPDEPATASS